MQFQNKNKLTYFAALSLFLSYIEFIFPRFLPFFKIGLGNSAILLALNFNFTDFFVLEIIRIISSCVISGTIFTPYVFISLGQGIFSGFAMFFLNKIKGNWISLYGISIFGSLISGFIQIFLSGIYLGQAVNVFLGPVIIFSVISGITTAFFAYKISPLLEKNVFFPENSENISDSFVKSMPFPAVPIFFIFIAVVFINRNFFAAVFLAILSLTVQKIRGRKILILPFLSLCFFVIFTSVFSPSGIVMFNIFNFSVTKGALEEGILKSLKLVTVFSLSQIFVTFKIHSNNIFSQTIQIYDVMIENFRKRR